MYLNTQSGGFSKVNVDVLFPLTEYVTKNWKFQMKFLNFKDDGLFDLVVFPSSGTQPQSLASQYDYYAASNPIMSGPNFSDPANVARRDPTSPDSLKSIPGCQTE